MIRVSYQAKTKTFICECDFNEREFPKTNGFFWSPITRQWETRKLSKAIRLRDFFDESAKERIQCNSIQESPWSGGLLIPPTQKLKPFQKRGALFALSRNHSYIAFEQGLGKTPTAISIINTVALPTLIICPPFLVENWKRELRAWLINGEPASIVSGKQIDVSKTSDIIILPDSLLDRELIHQFLQSQDFGLLIIDEAHRFKNLEAKRTKNIFEVIAPMIPKVVCLSGTPMPNRPMELFPVLSSLAHDTIDFYTHHEYGEKYCNAHQKPYGWDYSGASNLSQLKGRVVNTFMVRETKADVLPELEPKEERVIILNGKIPNSVNKLDRNLKNKFSPSDLANKQNLGIIAEYRKEVGLIKVPLILEYVIDILESSDESILLLAWHTEVLDRLYNGLSKFSRTTIYGKTPMKQRDLSVAGFQAGDYRVINAQIQTMVGHNLTKGTRAIFGEYSWTPADNDQASDRLHRIGQKDSVTVDYLTLAKTLDEYMLDSLLAKQKNISKVITK